MVTMKLNSFRLRLRWILRAASLFVLLTALSGTVLAGSSLAFLDTETLAYALEDPPVPVHVTVRNDGGAVDDLSFNVTALRNSEGVLAGDGAISIQSDISRLDAYAIETFALTLSYQGSLAPGVYNGFLTVSASDTTPGHRPFLLEVPEEAEEEPGTSLAGLVPQSSEITIVLTRFWPFGPQQTGTDVTLYGSGIDTLDLNAIQALEGVLQTDRGASGTVTLSQYESVSSEELHAVLTFSDVSQSGTYTGNLQLTPMDPENGQTITVTALVQHHWIDALAVTALGVILAYFISLWMERAGPAELVRAGYEAIQVAIGKETKEPVGGHPDYTINQSINQWVNDIEETLSRGSIDAAKENLSKLDGRLEEFLILRFWTINMRKRCMELEILMEQAKETYQPIVLLLSQELLVGYEIPDSPYENTNLQAASKAVADGDGLLAQFLLVYVNYLAVQEQIEQLAGLSGNHLTALPRFRRELRKIHDDLWNATSAKNLQDDENSILKRLSKVRMGLAQLIADPTIHTRKGWAPGFTWKLSTHRVSPPGREREEPSGWDKLRRYLGGSLRAFKLINVAVLAVTLILVTLSGLAILYPGKAFGTWDNYIAAFLWGSVGQQIAGYVGNLAAVAKMRLTP
jgi:hypothetical protein